MTKQEYDFLTAYDGHFTKVIETQSWCPFIQRKPIKRIVEILKKESKGTLPKDTANIYCQDCLVQIMLGLYPYYVKYKDKQDEREESECKGEAKEV